MTIQIIAKYFKFNRDEGDTGDNGKKTRHMLLGLKT